MSFRVADRVAQLPPYIFSEINVIKAQAKARGVELLSLGIGDPDLPTPSVIVEKMVAAVKKPTNHAYSPYEGSELFRDAARHWFQRRFGVALETKNIIALIGSKEGIAHFPMAFINAGEGAVYPSPGYPVFETSITLAGGRAIPLPLKAEHGFVPQAKQVEQIFLSQRPKYMLLNFPSNPTSVVCPRETLEEIVYLAKRHSVILAYDNAYSEIYFDEKRRPISLLEIPGAEDVAIEFHSLSKTFNMTGWRVGFAAGNPDLVAGLLKYKTNIDSGPFLAAQEAGAFALDQAEVITPPIRAVYAERLAYAKKALGKLRIEYLDPSATFYVWAKVPGNRSSMDFAIKLIEAEGLVVTPGIGFGKDGEGFFRLALTTDLANLKIAFDKLTRFLK
ncbi:MAG: aminotransferase class I/II-fold pyridoxal phosphate-dependent enzyme [Deltaproteobacteria bacterium]|nr:aminotransferase class I/II-fold pyridoxal phosphate-dependent enzyme [Deltaproteobacteria bacterium]MBI3294856.1 aminotransferase class I/II-fold pyridoxal phosphate-dependent enzyme [Deltaproteobacteria bacterium]